MGPKKKGLKKKIKSEVFSTASATESSFSDSDSSVLSIKEITSSILSEDSEDVRDREKPRPKRESIHLGWRDTLQYKKIQQELQDATTVTRSVRKKKKTKKTKKVREEKKLELSNVDKTRMAKRAQEEAQRAEREEKLQREKEKRDMEEKQIKDVYEQGQRMEQLRKTTEHFHETEVVCLKGIEEVKKKMEWDKYVRAEKLPNSVNVVDTYSYLFQWKETMNTITLEETAKKIEEAKQLLDYLEFRITTITSEEELKFGSNWRWIKSSLRKQVIKSIEKSTYYLLCDIVYRLNRIDVFTADYKFINDNIQLYIWTKVPMPVSYPNPKKPLAPKIAFTIPEMAMSVVLPLSIDCNHMAIRIMHLPFDYLSDRCATYLAPEDVFQRTQTLDVMIFNEWRERLLYKFEKSSFNPKQRSSNVPLPKQSIVGDEKMLKLSKASLASVISIPLVPYEQLDPTPDEMIFMLDQMIYKKINDLFKQELSENEINLREYAILGGIYFIEYVVMPPQPHEFMILEATINRFVTKSLEKSNMYIPCTLPSYPERPPYPEDFDDKDSIDKLTTEKDIEFEYQRLIQEHQAKLLAIFDGLIQIELEVPKDVYFFEAPSIAQWDEKHKLWTRKDIFDYKIDENYVKAHFQTGKLGPFAFVSFRYSNFPFRFWEILPREDGSVLLKIVCNIIMIDINIRKDGKMAIVGFYNANFSLLSNIAGQYYLLPDFEKLLKAKGLNIFLDCDSICYIQESSEKNWPMERHAYFCMAHMSLYFYFCSSKWNQILDNRKLALLFREYNALEGSETTQSPELSTVFVTPLQTVIVDCHEDSESWSETPIEGMKFAANLWYLMRNMCTVAFIAQVKSTPKELTYWLFKLLSKLRLFSCTQHLKEEKIEDLDEEEKIEKPKKKKKKKKQKK